MPAPQLLDSILFFLGSLYPPFSKWLNLPFGTQGRSRRLKAFSLQTRNKGHKKSFCTQEDPTGPCSVSISEKFNHSIKKSHISLAVILCIDPLPLYLLGNVSTKILYQPRYVCMYNSIYVCMYRVYCVCVCVSVYGKREREWQNSFILGGSQPLLQGLQLFGWGPCILWRVIHFIKILLI